MKDFKYKTSFSSTIKCIIDEEKDKILSKASLDNLKSIIPKEYQNQIDLLPISFNACTPNLGNKNGDMIDSEIALNIYKGFIARPVNAEHNRAAGAFGHIVSAAFSKFNEKYLSGYGSEIIEASEIKDKKNPVNLSLAAVLYKVYSPGLIEEIEKSNDPNSERFMKISASWELMFDSFNLAVGSKYLEDCEIISDEKEVEKNKKYLIGEGGEGKLPDGRPVYRLLKGAVYALGIGLTENEAAEVKGIYVNNGKDLEIEANNKENIMKIEELNKIIEDKVIEIVSKAKKCKAAVCPECGQEMDMEDEMDDEEDVNCAKCGKKSKAKMWKNGKDKELKEESKANNDKNMQNNENSLSQAQKSDVKQNTNIYMKIKSLKDVTDENLKECKASELQDVFASDLKEQLDTEVKKINDKYVKDLGEKDTAIKAATDKVADLQKSSKEIQDKLDELSKSHEKLVKANEEKEKLETFSNRMSTIDETFDLGEEEKKIIGDEVKAIENDEAFANYIKKMDILLSAKKKSKKVFDKKTMKWVDPEKVEKTEEAKASTNTVEDVTKDGKKTEATIPNTTSTEPTLIDKAKAAFGSDNWEMEKSKRNRKN